nr:hypothetical protein [uncultured Devosia sp.]
MQLLLIIAALLSFPSLRRLLRNNPMTASIGVIATAASWLSEMVWDTNYIFHRTPIWYFWTVGGGMLIACAQNARDRLIAIAVVTVAVIMHHGFSSGGAYILGGSALLLFLPELTVPHAAKVVFAEIAGSSMFIYLSHYQVNSLIVRLFKEPVPWLALFAAIGFRIASSRV